MIPVKAVATLMRVKCLCQRYSISFALMWIKGSQSQHFVQAVKHLHPVISKNIWIMNYIHNCNFDYSSYCHDQQVYRHFHINWSRDTIGTGTLMDKLYNNNFDWTSIYSAHQRLSICGNHYIITISYNLFSQVTDWCNEKA